MPNTRFLPYRSASRPISGDVTSVASPPAKYMMRQVDLGEPDVGDVVRRDERNHREPREHERQRERERPQVIAHAEDRAQLRDAAAGASRARGAPASGGSSRAAAMPTPTLSTASARNGVRHVVVRGDPQAGGHAGDGGERERRGDDRRRRRAARERHEVGDDREHESARDAAEDAPATIRAASSSG